MGQTPVGTVTFLFTDIEGSTRAWEQHGDLMGSALARHDEILRSSIESNGGQVVKTMGDGALAVFATAKEAIDSAVAAQRAIGSEAWTVPDPLRVRMGIHSGPVEVRDGDYHGTAVNRAARIMAVAHGGQVVISAAAYELVRDSTAEVVDLGEHRLKDLSEPERIFQVVHADLDRDFPPLRSLTTQKSNLPTLRSTFVGRKVELDAVSDALADVRLVTLTGVGGVGKTRLAVQVAAELSTGFPDGVWLIELAAVGDPASVPDAVATTLGLVPQPGLTTTDTVVSALAGRRILLVLDNCEHVLDAAAELVDAVLDRPGPAKVLATSREGLRVADERLWPVPSLGTGRESDDAVYLFVDRARAASPDFALDGPGTAEAVEEICRRLDGIPLAIELAAARTIAMSAPELRDRLDDRFRLLSGSRRGLERHQTLRQAVQWSYDLLDDDERELLDRSSVFAGGFDIEAAVAVIGDDRLDEYVVLDGLDALVRKSLVTADRSSGRTRYGLLETIRQFAEEQLAAGKRLAEMQGRHARHFADRSHTTLLGWCQPEQPEHMFDDVPDWSNLRAGFRAAADAGDLDSAAALAVYTTALGFHYGHPEAHAWAEELVESARDSHHPLLGGLCAAAAVCASTGRVDDAYRYAEEARALIEVGGATEIRIVMGSGLVSSAYMFMGRADRWVDFCRAEFDKASGSLPLVPTQLVTTLALARQTDEAVALAPLAVAAADASGVPFWQAQALQGYSVALLDRDPPAALAAMRRAAVLFEGLAGNFQGSYSLLARIEAAHGDAYAALEACAMALDSYAASGNRLSACTPQWVLASLLHRLGRDEPAAIVAGSGLGPDQMRYAALAAMFPELAAAIDDLRAVLGDERFDTLAGEGAAMDNTTAFNFCADEIDAARPVLLAERDTP